jgi:hypothetical protein
MPMTTNTKTFLAEAAPAAPASYGDSPVCAERRTADADALAGRHAR